MELQSTQMERKMSGERLASTLLLESTILEEEKAAEVEKSRGQAAAPFASDSAAKKWAEEWSR